MEAHVLLADSAQVDSKGKVHALGLGWSNTSIPLPAQAVVVLIKIPWTAANIKHTLHLALIDADGKAAVEIPSLTGDTQPLVIDGEFETGRPAGLPHGTPLDFAAAFNLSAGLPLSPGRYNWRLSIDGHAEETWTASFLVRPADSPQQPSVGG